MTWVEAIEKYLLPMIEMKQLVSIERKDGNRMILRFKEMLNAREMDNFEQLRQVGVETGTEVTAIYDPSSESMSLHVAESGPGPLDVMLVANTDMYVMSAKDARALGLALINRADRVEELLN